MDIADVRFDRRGPLGVIELDRPRAINALTTDMCRAITAQLEQWRDDDAVAAVVVTGAGDRGLCAGGDVKAVRAAVVAGDLLGAGAFFAAEYPMDQLLATYPKRVVALMDGIVMGGGLGISAHTDLRIVTPRSRLAMPETIIGLWPDVGITYRLARAGELGTHLALVGATFGGADAITAGLADVMVGDLDAVWAALEADPHVAASDLPGVVDAAAPDVVAASPVAPIADEPWLACYRADTAAEILAALRERAPEVAAELAECSPHSVVLTLRALQRARVLSLSEVFAQDAILAQHMITHPDFSEGVRCRLVDKGDTPQWADASVAHVDTRAIQRVLG